MRSLTLCSAFQRGNLYDLIDNDYDNHHDECVH